MTIIGALTAHLKVRPFKACEARLSWEPVETRSTLCRAPFLGFGRRELFSLGVGETAGLRPRTGCAVPEGLEDG